MAFFRMSIKGSRCLFCMTSQVAFSKRGNGLRRKFCFGFSSLLRQFTGFIARRRSPKHWEKMSVVPVFIITLRNALKVLGKAAIVGGAAFFTYDYGIWGTGDNNQTHMRFLKTNAEENMQNIMSHIPFHELPTSEEMKITWNNGMDTVFTTLDEAPRKVVKLSDKVKQFVKSSPPE